MLQVLADVHRPLMELLVEEAFNAILEVSAADSGDVKAHELKGAMPPVEVGGSPAMLLAGLAVITVQNLPTIRPASPGFHACLPFPDWRAGQSQAPVESAAVAIFALKSGPLMPSCTCFHL